MGVSLNEALHIWSSALPLAPITVADVLSGQVARKCDYCGAPCLNRSLSHSHTCRECVRQERETGFSAWLRHIRSGR